MYGQPWQMPKIFAIVGCGAGQPQKVARIFLPNPLFDLIGEPKLLWVL